MSNGSKPTPKKSDTDGKRPEYGVQFANVYLDSSQKAQAGLLLADPDKLTSWVETLLGDGYNLSFSYSERSDSFVCTVIGKTCGLPNQGWAMASHGGTWFEALARALFKHFILRGDDSFADMVATHTYPQP